MMIRSYSASYVTKIRSVLLSTFIRIAFQNTSTKFTVNTIRINLLKQYLRSRYVEIFVSTRPILSALTLYWRSPNLARLKRTLCCVLSNLNLCFWRLWNDPYNLVVVLCNFRSFDFDHTRFVLSKIVLTFNLRSRWKLIEKESPACRVRILLPITNRVVLQIVLLVYPIITWKKINLLVMLFMRLLNWRTWAKSNTYIYIYHVKKSWQKRKHAHNTRNDTQCSKKARLDRYYEDFDTIKIPQHKHTFIHTIVRERGTLEMNKSPADGGLHIAHVDIIHQLRTFDSANNQVSSFQDSLFIITVSWLKIRKKLKRGETCFCVKGQILMLQRHTPGSFYGCRYRILLLNSH